MCAGLLGEAVTRALFFKQADGLPGATLQVDVLFEDASGTTQAQGGLAELGVASSGGSWPSS